MARAKRVREGDVWLELTKTARAREIAALKRRRANMTPEAYDEATRRVMFASDWVAPHVRKPLPSLWTIASYWAERDKRANHEGLFQVNLDDPHCFGCRVTADLPDTDDLEERWYSSGWWLERGHLVNWARDGLDQVQNIVPLCRICNRFMPIFDAEHAAEAIAWVATGGAVETVREFFLYWEAKQKQQAS
jgi:hypothetical protein